jgi:hypothetical protein
MARPERLELPTFWFVGRYAVKNSKCCFWCRLQGNAPFISLLNWTEVGLKWLGMSDSKVVDAPFE